jgi:hypothetical protein
MYIRFKTKKFATEFIDAVKKSAGKSFYFKEFGTWDFYYINEKENGIVISYRNRKTDYIIIINIFIDKYMKNQIIFNTYEGYDSIYTPLFYNEYKQLFYNDYFIGE